MATRMMQRRLLAARLAAPRIVMRRFSAGPPAQQFKSFGIVGIAIGGAWFAYEQYMRQYKAFVEPCELGLTDVSHTIKRTVDADIKTRLACSDRRTTIVAGQPGVGKTFAIASALRGEQGVVRAVVDNPGWRLDLYRSVGVTSHTSFVKAMQRAKDFLGKPPLLYLEVPRGSKADVKELSGFCRQMVSDERTARVVVVTSQLRAALGFDADGVERQYGMWIAPMTDGEALEYLSKQLPELPQADAERIIKEVGTNTWTLESIAMDITEKAMTVDAALETRYQECKAEVTLFHTVVLQDDRGKRHSVGREITDELLKSKQVSNERWNKQGFPVEATVEKIEQLSAYTVSYHTLDKMWHFQSPMHERIVREGR